MSDLEYLLSTPMAGPVIKSPQKRNALPMDQMPMKLLVHFTEIDPLLDKEHTLKPVTCKGMVTAKFTHNLTILVVHDTGMNE